DGSAVPRGRHGATLDREHHLGATDPTFERRLVHRVAAADRPLGHHVPIFPPTPARAYHPRCAAAAPFGSWRACMHLDRRLLGWGIFFVLLGAIPLAVRAGLLDRALVGQWPLLWPVLLIGWGLGLLLRG